MLPVELRGEFTPLISGEVGDELKPLLKCADRLSAYVKCVEERKAGNLEFLSAERQTLGRIRAMGLAEAEYFLENFMPAFEKNLDELGTMSKEDEQ
jgi:5'-deoxynucleotidase